MSSAQAYIDPGTFSIIFQAIVGAIVAGGVAIKIYWYKFRSFFKKKDKDEEK
jgi:high-affinity Fe2+/Pb2+ permease